MSGLELLEKLHIDGHSLPAIMITGKADVPMAVKAMKAGALDFIEKPIAREELITSIERALELSHDSGKLMEWRANAAAHLTGLTPRQQDVLERVLRSKEWSRRRRRSRTSSDDRQRQRPAEGTVIPDGTYMSKDSTHDRCAGSASGRDRLAARLDQNRPPGAMTPIRSFSS